jgi:ribonuclease D
MPRYPEGEIDVRSGQAAVESVRALEPARELAVDAEADSMHAFRARLCFIQVGTDDRIYLFDTLESEVRPDSLAPLLGDPARTKFIHAAGGDLQFLAEAGVRVQGLFDTHRAATLLGWPKVGLADLAQQLLEIQLPKEHQQADFSLRPLPDELRTYIANDVRDLCEIGRRVREACLAADVMEEVELDCQRLCDEAAARPAEAQFRPKIPRGGLSREQYALAQAIALELHRRRLQWAEAADVPMGRMLSNAAVVALSTRPPTTLKELARAQGVRGPFVRQHGEEVLQLLRELQEKGGRGELPATSAAAPPDPGRRKREEALRAFRTEKALLRKVTPSVVLSNALVSELSASVPPNLDTLAAVPYFGEKRVRLYGPELLALLSA